MKYIKYGQTLCFVNLKRPQGQGHGKKKDLKTSKIDRFDNTLLKWEGRENSLL